MLQGYPIPFKALLVQVYLFVKGGGERAAQCRLWGAYAASRCRGCHFGVQCAAAFPGAKIECDRVSKNLCDCAGTDSRIQLGSNWH